MFSVIHAAKYCFNGISKVASLKCSIPTPKVYNYVSTASVSKMFVPHQQKDYLHSPCYTSTGTEKLKLSSNFSSFSVPHVLSPDRSLLKVKEPSANTVRTVTKFSLSKGTKRYVGAVIKRFYRLHNGLWIRRVGGYKKKLYTKSEKERFRLRQHIICSRDQCEMLDKMVTDKWKKPRYYIDDPYEPYQVRHDIDNILPFKNHSKKR